MVTKKSWQDFRDTGLFMFVNTILHAFGWALVVEVDTDTKEVTDCYPARVKFRGFAESDQSEMHRKIGSYLQESSDQLAAEANDE
jgi:hypothetical protein